MSQKIGQEGGSEKPFMNAIRHLGGSKNTSLQPLQAPSNQLVNVRSDFHINQLGLKNDAGKGLLSKFDNGNHKIKESARRRKSRSRSRRRKSTPKRRSRSRKRSGSKRRKRSSSGRRRRKRSSSGRRRRKRSSSGKRKRSTSKRRRSRRRRKTPVAEEN